MESRPSPSPYKGAAGSMSCGSIGRFNASTKSEASSRSRSRGARGRGWGAGVCTRELYSCGLQRQPAAGAWCSRAAAAGTPRRQQGQAQQKTAQQTQVHPCQKGIVAPVLEMRDAALVRSEITHRCSDIDRLEALPAKAHGGFRIEIESPHPTLS